MRSSWATLCWQRRSESKIHWALCYAGRGCHAYRNGSRRICTRIGHKRKEDTTAWVAGHGSLLEFNTFCDLEKKGIRQRRPD